MSDWASAMLIGGIVAVGMSPIILIFAWLPMRRKSAGDEVTPQQRMAVLRNTAIALILVAVIAASGFMILRKSAPPADTTMESAGMPGMGSGGGTASHTSVPQIPGKLAGLPLAETLTGQDALRQIDSMHPSQFPVSDAVVGYYKGMGHEATIWVAVTPAESMGPAMSQAMASAISGGNTPFGEPQQMGGGVWRMEGMGQVHYFFPSGGSVWWLSADGPLADRSLEQTRAAAGL